MQILSKQILMTKVSGLVHKSRRTQCIHYREKNDHYGE